VEKVCKGLGDFVRCCEEEQDVEREMGRRRENNTLCDWFVIYS
jgi:hypothetical protein